MVIGYKTSKLRMRVPYTQGHFYSGLNEWVQHHVTQIFISQIPAPETPLIIEFIVGLDLIFKKEVIFSEQKMWKKGVIGSREIK